MKKIIKHPQLMEIKEDFKVIQSKKPIGLNLLKKYEVKNVKKRNKNSK